MAAIGLGIAVGLIWPVSAPILAGATNPVLALLLFATFLGVPLIEVGRAFRDMRFLGTVLVVNFVVVPVIAFGLSRFVADGTAQQVRRWNVGYARVGTSWDKGYWHIAFRAGQYHRYIDDVW